MKKSILILLVLGCFTASGCGGGCAGPDAITGGPLPPFASDFATSRGKEVEPIGNNQYLVTHRGANAERYWHEAARDLCSDYRVITQWVAQDRHGSPKVTGIIECSEKSSQHIEHKQYEYGEAMKGWYCAGSELIQGKEYAFEQDDKSVQLGVFVELT